MKSCPSDVEITTLNSSLYASTCNTTAHTHLLGDDASPLAVQQCLSSDVTGEDHHSVLEINNTALAVRQPAACSHSISAVTMPTLISLSHTL